MQYKEQDLDSGTRFFQALLLSLAGHGALLALVVLSSAWAGKNPIIRPGAAVFVTPVHLPKRPVIPEKSPEPPQPKPEPERLKKPAMTEPMKKLAKPKIVPKGSKTKTPEPVKPPEPPKPATPPKPAPQRPAPPDAQPEQKNFRTEGEEFKYDYYVKIVKRKVEESWITHGLDVAGQTGSPEVYFRIQRDGSISDVRLEKSSGSGSLDQSAMEAVKNSALPPLPTGYAPDSLGVYYNFEYAQRD